MKQNHSEGKCLFCDETFAKSKINHHLATHIKEKVTKNTQGKSFYVMVEADVMFLSLWVDGKTTFADLDLYLRQIWLECCGHMSSFIDPQKRKKEKGLRADFFSNKPYTAPGEIAKKEKVANVLVKGIKLDYQYDFGSTTYLQINVIEEFQFCADNKILLLSRNEPLEILCQTCNKEIALHICSIHAGYEEALFCNKCAKKHEKDCEDFADYARMPVVNSPRMGTCAYEGGDIDKQRDGVFKRK